VRTRARPPAPATGAHQPGIVTRQPPHLALTAFDVVGEGRAELRRLLAAWTTVAARLGADVELTFGLGPGLFDAGRLGLDALRPVGLTPLPAFPGDALEPARGGGDLLVQAGAGDPVALVEALGALAGAADGVATARWTQTGFRGGTPRPDGRPRVPRDLLGYLDAGPGPLDAGLAFVAFVRDPRRQYVPVQRRLAEDDALSAYAVHTASAVFAIPPAPRAGDALAGRLLEAAAG
jgi:dye decolorizing peroxidase